MSNAPIFAPESVAAATAKLRIARAESKRRRDHKPGRDHLPWEAPPDLAHRLTVPELVAVYEQAERDIREGFGIVARAEKQLNAAFTLGELHGISVNNGHNRSVNFDLPEEPLAVVRRSIWKSLVERLGLRQFLSIEAAKKLAEQLDRGDMPELTVENVLTMADGFRQQIPQMLEASVREVFEWLTPQRHYDAYKTNSPFVVGRKVIMTRMIHHDSWSGWRPHYGYAEDRLTATENVFSALDGKGSITKSYYSALSNAIRAVPKDQACEGSTPYFKFRGFGNGNLHVTFLRADLLKRFNQIAAGANLMPKTDQ